jgi:hypothetical protein
MFTSDDVVYSFTRQDAFDEGMLFDASTVAAEAGFRVPLALTDSVWAECVAWPSSAPGGWGQSEDGRLWDVVYMAACAARRGPNWGRSRVSFEVYRVPSTGGRATRVKLELALGPGDAGELVATVMLPGED